MTPRSVEQLRRECMRRWDTGFESVDDASSYFASVVAAVREETLREAILVLERLDQAGQQALRHSSSDVAFGNTVGVRDAIRELTALRAQIDSGNQDIHYWTPDPTKRFCVVCGDNALGSVWGVHRFQIQPGDPDFKPSDGKPANAEHLVKP
jgi:hypothetical protein